MKHVRKLTATKIEKNALIQIVDSKNILHEFLLNPDQYLDLIKQIIKSQSSGKK